MSSPRYIWWPYVKAMIRVYPERELEYLVNRNMKTTANYDPQAGGVSGPTRKTEDFAIGYMTATSTREYFAVKSALDLTMRKRTGEERVRMIELVYWEKRCTLAAAAMRLHIGERTAQRWNREFVYLVAKEFGLL